MMVYLIDDCKKQSQYFTQKTKILEISLLQQALSSQHTSGDLNKHVEKFKTMVDLGEDTDDRRRLRGNECREKFDKNSS